ncbi:MAG: catalase-related domain-containing protein, partial [Bergeyella zoohelcum]|nr:catalase-related domain-containing protein [Bergeyella zoohelcum]
KPDPAYKAFEDHLDSTHIAHFNRNENDDDHFTQPGLLYSKAMNDEDRANLVSNIVASMSGIDGPKRDEIVNRQLCHFFRANLELGMRVAAGLGVNIDASNMHHK